MSVETIVTSIDDEIYRLTKASEFLQRFQHESKTLTPKVASLPQKKHTMSAAARNKIGAATHARWESLKKAAAKNGK